MEEVITAKDVIQALTLACKMTGFDLDDSEKQFYLKKLKGRMSGEQTICALDDMIEKGIKPTLANILSYERGGYDAPEIAYAKAIANMTDETKTCLMNNCIAQAWSVAQPLYSEGMKFEANRAFIATYNDMVLKHKQSMPKPNWWLSLGTDKQQRDDFVRESVQAGLISLESAKATLPHLTDSEITQPGLVDLSPKKALIAIEDNSKSEQLTEEEREVAKKALAGIKNLIGACNGSKPPSE